MFGRKRSEAHGEYEEWRRAFQDVFIFYLFTVNKVNSVWARKPVLKNASPALCPPSLQLAARRLRARAISKKWSNCNQSFILWTLRYLVMEESICFDHKFVPLSLLVNGFGSILDERIRVDSIGLFALCFSRAFFSSIYW